MAVLAAGLLVFTDTPADDTVFEVNGHSKLRLVGQRFGEHSVFRETAGATTLDAAGELRLNGVVKQGGWSLQADYQLLAVHSEFLPAGLPGDDQRWFDLTHTLRDGSSSAVVHRLDRLWLGHTGAKTTVRFGRQALTWGNGLFYTPMDLVNPFDPATVDTEYKSGDDMLYAQYLRDSGDDIQAAYVFRRDPQDGAFASELATAALKYHGFAGDNEYDVLVADDGDDRVIGLGGARSLGGAVLRGDLVHRDGAAGSVTELVANLSYSWVWAGKNISGVGELYRGEHDTYAGGSLAIEMSPLWMLTPTMLADISEPSALLQLITRYSLSDNMTLLASFNLPLGANGTRYGGPDSGIPGRYLSFEAAIFAQLAWYF